MQDMKDFVTSQPAAGALFTVVLDELCDFSVATFQQKIERYAEGGGDGGLTRATMRAACGLPAEDVALHPDGAGHAVAPRPGARVVETEAARQVPGTVHQVVRPRVRAEDRVGTLRQLKARGWWKELPTRGRSRATLISRFPMERGVLDLLPPVPDGAEPVAHRETLSVDPCVSW